jgi:tight adherence protein C
MILFFSAGGFMVIFLMGIGLVQISRKHIAQKQVVAKIQQHIDLPGEFHNSNGTTTAREGTKAHLKFLRRIGEKMSPKESDKYTVMKQRFLKAGIQSDSAAPVFWGAKILLPFLLVVLLVVLRSFYLKLLPAPFLMGLSVGLAFLGFYLPEIWLVLKTSQRRDQIFRGLPDALDLMVVCVEAGMGMDAAINRVGQEMALSNKAISEEFKLINLEVRAGMRREDALRNLSLRTDLEDVRGLVTLLVQTDKFGTSIAQSLRVFADSFRSKRFQRAEEMAAKMPVKLIFPLILFIFPSLFIVAVGPGAIRIYQNILMQ